MTAEALVILSEQCHSPFGRMWIENIRRMGNRSTSLNQPPSGSGGMANDEDKKHHMDSNRFLDMKC